MSSPFVFRLDVSRSIRASSAERDNTVRPQRRDLGLDRGDPGERRRPGGRPRLDRPLLTRNRRFASPGPSSNMR
jgi:hypothetical protein